MRWFWCFVAIALAVASGCQRRWNWRGSSGSSASSAGAEAAPGLPTHRPSPWPAFGAQPAPSVGGGEKDTVVIAAIEQYDHLPPVRGALASAEDWYRYFVDVRRVPPGRITKVASTPSGVTVKKMRGWVRDAADEARRARGRLWFVFIGHGAPVPDPSNTRAIDGLLVDANARRDELSGLQQGELLTLMASASSPGQQPVAILDACFSGTYLGDDGRVQSVTGSQMSQIPDFMPKTRQGVTVLSAAGTDEQAYPLPNHTTMRPAFSYLMLGALRGWGDQQGYGNQDGFVTTGEAIGFTRTALNAFGTAQRPQLSGSGDVKLTAAAKVPPIDLSAVAAAKTGGQPGWTQTAQTPPQSQSQSQQTQWLPPVRPIEHPSSQRGAPPPLPAATHAHTGTGQQPAASTRPQGGGGHAPGVAHARYQPVPMGTAGPQTGSVPNMPGHVHLQTTVQGIFHQFCVKTDGSIGTITQLVPHDHSPPLSIALMRSGDREYVWAGRQIMGYNAMTFVLQGGQAGRGAWRFMRMCIQEAGVCFPVRQMRPQ